MKVSVGAYLCFLYLCIMEETISTRSLYKLLLLTIKVIPMLLAFTALLNTTLSYFGIDWEMLSYIGGVSILPLLFLYLASYAFRFCEYHRMFLHYVTVNWGLNIYDYYIGVPISDRDMIALYLMITCVFMFMILYLYLRTRKKQ